MKISQRLKLLDQMVGQGYSHIWDCCCDHGLLGMSLLARHAAGTVHFVDRVPALMDELATRLTRFFPQPLEGMGTEPGLTRWRVHCLDVAQLMLPGTDTAPDTATEKKPQLIIIAGVGGDLMLELVQGILAANPGLECEFILSPVHHNYKLRLALRQLGFGLLDEKLIEENRRFYEILHLHYGAGDYGAGDSGSDASGSGVRRASCQTIAPVGSLMWDWDDPLHHIYLKRTLSHYGRMKSQPEAEAVVRAYLALLPELNRPPTEQARIIDSETILQ